MSMKICVHTDEWVENMIFNIFLCIYEDDITKATAESLVEYFEWYKIYPLPPVSQIRKALDSLKSGF